MTRFVWGGALALCVAGAVAARAETQVFHALLTAGAEVPPKGGDGKGEAMATLDTATRKLDYTVSFSGLSGPATMAHVHGPAAPGANAGVEVPLGMNPTSPIKGSATLTPAQVSDLEAGKMYVNVHTAANPGGEIRGQLMR